MEGTKRCRSDSFHDLHNTDDRKKQLTATQNSDSSKNITQFKDLANELIYEIFEYLDYYYVYKGFFNLNIRLHSLLMQSTLPLKINLFTMSQTTFHRYNQDIILPNTHRIHTLRIPNHFMFDHDTLALSQKIFLQTLVLENIESYYLDDLLDQFTLLLQLSSLTIIAINAIDNKSSIYQKIFRLPSMKYCKVLLGDLYSEDILPYAINDHSPIEHLIIVDRINPQQLNSLLSYVPHLRRLRVDLTQQDGYKAPNIPYYTLKNLTHASLKLHHYITYIELQELLINSFPFVEVLHISAMSEALDANEWKRLISMHLLDLRIFDVFFTLMLSSDAEKIAFDEQVNLFRSSFWIERQWFFDYRLRQTEYSQGRFLYSINRYRRKDYELSYQLNDTICGNETRDVFKSVDHVEIGNEKVIEKFNDYFPNATKLTIKRDFCAAFYRSIPTNLDRILSLQKLQTLIIKRNDLSLLKLIELLTYTPNLHRLTFRTMPLYNESKISIEQNETFQSISKTNCLIYVTYQQSCTLEEVELLVMLFPRLQHLAINTQLDNVEPILQFLLKENNENTRDLALFSLIYANRPWFDHLDRLFMLKTLPQQCKATYMYPHLFVCW
ncbi:hypothetical protein I4U23_016763 [Adineta vaga]|nr:hypothetical protein I4U23_016763 [Adineta vaga]